MMHSPETGLNPFAHCPNCTHALTLAYDDRHLWCEVCNASWAPHEVYPDILSKLEILRNRISAQKEAKYKTYTTLSKRKLPIPKDLKAEVEKDLGRYGKVKE